MTTDAILSAAAAPGADYAATASEAYRAALRVIESVEPRIAAATRKGLTDQRESLNSADRGGHPQGTDRPT